MLVQNSTSSSVPQQEKAHEKMHDRIAKSLMALWIAIGHRLRRT